MEIVTSTNKRLKTGIDGLDDLLQGGILPLGEDGLIIMIKGPPGAGKTTLALQIAVNSKKWGICESSSAYWTIEQHRDDIQRKAGILGMQKDEPTMDIQGIDEFLDSPLEEGLPFWSVRPVVEACLVLHKRMSEKQGEKRRIMILDGLNLLGRKEREHIEIERLLTLLRKKCRIGIVVFEPSPDTYGSIDYHADLVIELRGQELQEPVRYFLTELRISKSRFQQSVLGWHQYKTRNEGIRVFPSVHFRLSRHKPVDTCVSDSMHSISDLAAGKNRIEFTATNATASSSPESTRTEDWKSEFHEDDPSILSFFIKQADSMKTEGELSLLERGSSTVLLGPRRCLKTQLTFDFLRAGSIMEKPEPGLLVSLIDNQSTIIEQRKSLCERCCATLKRNEPQRKDCGNDNCYHHVYLLHMPLGCITPAEFLHWLEHRLQCSEQENGQRLQRLVFWDLAQLEFRFPLLAHDPMFLPGLMDYLKYSPRCDTSGKGKPRKVTSLFMGPPNNELARAASAMADNVLFCWPDNRGKQEGIAVYVDRIEGHPGEQKLYFAGAEDRPSKADKTPGMNFRLYLPAVYKEFKNAVPMIAEIQSLQGLRYHRRRLMADSAVEAP